MRAYALALACGLASGIVPEAASASIFTYTVDFRIGSGNTGFGEVTGRLVTNSNAGIIKQDNVVSYSFTTTANNGLSSISHFSDKTGDLFLDGDDIIVSGDDLIFRFGNDEGGLAAQGFENGDFGRFDLYAGSQAMAIPPLVEVTASFSSYAQEYPVGFTLVVGSLSSVPLPASASMFGAALLALGAAGYGVKRKKAAAAA